MSARTIQTLFGSFVVCSSMFAQINTPWPASGSVGIGTATPTEKLEVVGGIKTSGATQGMSRFVLQSTAAGGQQYEWFNDYSGAGGGVLALYNRTKNKTPIAITAVGQVGIGTINPQATLDVSGGIRSAGNRPITIDGGTSMIFGQGDTGGWAFGYHGKGSAGTDQGGFGFLGGANTLIYYYIGSSYDNPTVVVTPNNGFVGIGTSNPTQKLSVNGSIRAKEVIVETTGWSDYVLAKDYSLPSLASVEHHIEREGTLPGIPSAEEVSKNGISLGEMQAKLLAKIEELTLHQIDQGKELSQLKAENHDLKIRVIELETGSRP